MRRLYKANGKFQEQVEALEKKVDQTIAEREAFKTEAAKYRKMPEKLAAKDREIEAKDRKIASLEARLAELGDKAEHYQELDSKSIALVESIADPAELAETLSIPWPVARRYRAQAEVVMVERESAAKEDPAEEAQVTETITPEPAPEAKPAAKARKPRVRHSQLCRPIKIQLGGWP